LIHGYTAEISVSKDICFNSREKDEASDNTDSQPETSLRPENCYLISPSPVRGGKAPGLSAKTNAHVIVEFGLQVN
jgi:U3 small nucleolar RNA-associated protein 20